MTEEQPWHSLTEAARLTGLDREALRSRARRGQLASRRSNRNELLVQVPADMLTEMTGVDPGHDHVVAVPDPSHDHTLTDLLAEIADLRTDLARAEAGREAAETARLTERDAAEAVRRAEVTALRELADRLTAELVEARRPWWRRLIG